MQRRHHTSSAVAAGLLVGPCSEHGNRWVVMADPDGNEFCVCDGGQTSGSTMDESPAP